MPKSTLQTSAERVEKDRVKMRVEVPESALSSAISAAYKRWANEIKVPGFRKGKIPRQLIDARVGPEVIREEALRDALPNFYREAVSAEEIRPIAPPDIEVVTFEEGEPLVFEATIDVRPDITLPDLTSLSIEEPSSEVDEDDVNDQLDRLRDRFAELETVGREARRGDYALIDLKGYRHDELVEGASAPDLLYEVGSHSGPPKLDDEIQGNRPGAILKFADAMPEGSGELAGEEIAFTVLLKEVKAKKLPALDDEFAKTVGDFDTLDALKDDLRARLAEVKERFAEDVRRQRALEALVDASPLEPPQRLVEEEFEHRLSHFEQDLKRAALTIEEYARQSQLTELEVRRDIRDQAARSVKAELLLEEVANLQNIEVTEEDLGRAVTALAAQAQREPKEMAKEVVEAGRLSALAADIMRSKALDHVTQQITGQAPVDAPAGREESLDEQ
jgi:trigger factor